MGSRQSLSILTTLPSSSLRCCEFHHLLFLFSARADCRVALRSSCRIATNAGLSSMLDAYESRFAVPRRNEDTPC